MTMNTLWRLTAAPRVARDRHRREAREAANPERDRRVQASLERAVMDMNMATMDLAVANPERDRRVQARVGRVPRDQARAARDQARAARDQARVARAAMTADTTTVTSEQDSK